MLLPLLSGADEGLPSLHGEIYATARTHLLGEKRATARPLLHGEMCATTRAHFSSGRGCVKGLLTKKQSLRIFLTPVR